MAKNLQILLKAEEPMFSHGLSRLEKTTGGSGIDARLIADITERAHKVMRKLGLDIKDTTCHELYFALMTAAKKDKCEELFFDTDFVMIIMDDQIISFNLIDLIENLHHELPFEKQIYSHAQRSLCGELVKRYSEHLQSNNDTTLEIAASMGILNK